MASAGYENTPGMEDARLAAGPRTSEGAGFGGCRPQGIMGGKRQSGGASELVGEALCQAEQAHHSPAVQHRHAALCCTRHLCGNLPGCQAVDGVQQYPCFLGYLPRYPMHQKHFLQSRKAQEPCTLLSSLIRVTNV